MSYAEAADQILTHVGGAPNIVSATHCATRLRFVLRDASIIDKSAIERVAIVKGSFLSGGQYQVVVGQGIVGRLFEELVARGGVNRVSAEEAKEDATANLNPAQRFARLLSNIFVPIIPVIVACGLLMGVLGWLKTSGWLPGTSSLFQLLDIFSNTAFVFLPILIAFSAGREFKVSPFLAAALGGIMIHPALQNAWTMGTGIAGYWDLFGLPIAKLGYQGTVLPVLIAVWIMAYVNRAVRAVVPDILDIVVTPFLTLIISAFIALSVIGPFGRLVGDGVSFGLQYVYHAGGAVAGLLFGGVYSAIVVTGIHHSFHAIEAGLLANPAIGVNFLLPIWSMANVAQGGACLAAFFWCKDEKIRQIAMPASVSCLLGITEAALFGVNLRLFRPFLAAAVGGALGGGYVAFNQVGMTAVGVTGLPGLTIVAPGSVIHYVIGMAIAFSVAFVCSFLFGQKDRTAG